MKVTGRRGASGSEGAPGGSGGEYSRGRRRVDVQRADNARVRSQDPQKPQETFPQSSLKADAETTSRFIKHQPSLRVGCA